MNEWATTTPVKNDPRLLAPTTIISLGGFCVRGLPVAPGEKIALPYHVATDLIYQGKAKLPEI